MRRYTDEEKVGKIKQLASRIKEFAVRNRSKILISVSSILIASAIVFVKISKLNKEISDISAQRDRYRNDLFSARDVAQDLSDRLALSEKQLSLANSTKSRYVEKFSKLNASYESLKNDYSQALKEELELKSKIQRAKERINTLSNIATVESYKLETMKTKTDDLLRQQMDIFARSRNIEGTTTTRNIRKQVNAVFEQIIGE